ncbi:hypothetical protein KKA15_01565 [Patescibacteria group bacterium]|nr:hypothetical protein [Patescibacteria group bacterium]
MNKIKKMLKRNTKKRPYIAVLEKGLTWRVLNPNISRRDYKKEKINYIYAK